MQKTSLAKVNNYELKYTSYGIPLYFANIVHDELKIDINISSLDYKRIDDQIIMICDDLDKQYDFEMNLTDYKKKSDEYLDNIAKEKTAKALLKIVNYTLLLERSAHEYHVFDWDQLYSRVNFDEKHQKPILYQKPPPPNYEEIPAEPDKNCLMYQPKISFIDRLIPGMIDKKTELIQDVYDMHHSDWEIERDRIVDKNRKLENNYNAWIDYIDNIYPAELIEWNKKKTEFNGRFETDDICINKLKESYFSCVPSAIAEYNLLVLFDAKYQDDFPKNYTIDYISSDKLLVVEYELPSQDVIPKISGYEYVKSKNTIISKQNKYADELYNDLIYQIALSTINRVLKADIISAIDNVAFNGFIKDIDRRNGKPIEPCILTIYVSRSDFEQLNLSLVEPKACFKSLGGIGNIGLSQTIPVAPIFSIKSNDNRFVEGYDVANQLSDDFNLASMDWEDFEHLIRELFEKEGSSAEFMGN